MEITKEQILAYHLAHRVKIQTPDGSIHKLEGINQGLLVIQEKRKSPYTRFLDPELNKMLLRPLSSLTKPITVEGYNDGKEFVPKTELGIVHDITKDGRILNFRSGENISIDSMPFWMINLLLSWNFNLFLQPGDFVEL